MVFEGMKNDNNKPPWRFVKSQQKGNIGVALLQNDEWKLAEDSKENAEVLTRQFQSVFTQGDGYINDKLDGLNVIPPTMV